MTWQGDEQFSAQTPRLLAIAGLIILALTQRSAITSLPPIIEEIRFGLGMSSATAGLLISIPVFCFGILTPVASVYIARTTIERALFTSFFLMILGIAVRSAGQPAAAFGGTIILGAGLSIANVIAIMVIARDFPQRSGLATGLYASAVNIGALTSSSLSAPATSGVGWQLSLLLWALFPIAGIAVWAGIQRSRRKPVRPATQCNPQPDGPPTPGLHGLPTEPILLTNQPAIPKAPQQAVTPSAHWFRRLPVWLIMLSFGLHSFLYYAVTAWLPKYLGATIELTVVEAGYAASTFQFLALVGSFAVPTLALVRGFTRPRLLNFISIIWIAVPAGLFLAPDLWPLWAVGGGIVQGGGFTVIFMLIVDLTTSLDDNRRVSSFVQGGGYTLAALAPPSIGLLLDTTGNWTVPFVVLMGVAVTLLATTVALQTALSRGTSR